MSEYPNSENKIKYLESVNSIEPLIESLRDPNPEVRETAAWRLARIKRELGIDTESALEPLLEAFNDENNLMSDLRELYQFRVNIIEALSQMCRDGTLNKRMDKKETIFRLITEALGNDKDVSVRQCAAVVSVDFTDFAIIEPLTRALEDEDEYVRKFAKESLEKTKKNIEE